MANGRGVLFSILQKKTWMYHDTSMLFLKGFYYFNKIPTSPIVVFCAALISLVGSNLK